MRYATTRTNGTPTVWRDFWNRENRSPVKLSRGEIEVRSPSIIKLGENNRQLTLQKSVREIEIPVCCSTKRFSTAGHLHGCEMSDVLAIRGTRRYFVTYLASAQGTPVQIRAFRPPTY